MLMFSVMISEVFSYLWGRSKMFSGVGKDIYFWNIAWLSVDILGAVPCI